MRKVSTVAGSDNADDDCDIPPSTTPCSSSGSHKHSREVVDWNRDEDEWIKERMKTQTAIEEKKT